jgi:hypothetical protein
MIRKSVQRFSEKIMRKTKASYSVMMMIIIAP